MMKIKLKLILPLLIFFLFLNCNTKKDKNEILVQKIKIENELCEDCIGLRTIKIKFFFNTNKLLNDSISLITNSSFLFNMKRIKYSPLEKNKFDYEYVFDKFDMSKYGSLNQIKKDYNKLIYFKRIKINNSDLVLVPKSNIQILYFLNGTNVDEKDTLKMNKDSDSKVVFPKHR